MFGALEVTIVGLFETVVSAILAQNKKTSFTGGRRELREGEMWSAATGIVRVDSGRSSANGSLAHAHQLSSSNSSSAAASTALPSPAVSEENANGNGASGTSVSETSLASTEDSNAPPQAQAQAQAPGSQVQISFVEEGQTRADADKAAGDMLMPIPSFYIIPEMFSLGLANMVCGLLGGLPCTGVLLRTDNNIKNGAETKASQVRKIILN